MSRYFFHLHDLHGPVLDEEGTDLADEAAALGHAAWCLRDFASNCILSGQSVDLGSYIAVCRADGHELRRLYMRDVIRFLPDARD
ncbi:MAG: hypothetical protein WCY29_10605 [Novosphingobium sp.]